MMKFVSMACACVLMLAPGALAHEGAVPEREARMEVAREVVERLELEAAFIEMIGAILPLAEPSIRQGWPDASDQQVHAAMAVFERAFIESAPEFVAEMIGVYAQSFSLQELEATAQFLRTPEGARFAQMQIPLSRQGQVVGERVGGKIAQRISPEIEAIMNP